MNREQLVTISISVITGVCAGSVVTAEFPKHPILAPVLGFVLVAFYGMAVYFDANYRDKARTFLVQIAVPRDNTGRGYFSLEQWIAEVRKFLGMPPADENAGEANGGPIQ